MSTIAQLDIIAKLKIIYFARTSKLWQRKTGIRSLLLRTFNEYTQLCVCKKIFEIMCSAKSLCQKKNRNWKENKRRKKKKKKKSYSLYKQPIILILLCTYQQASTTGIHSKKVHQETRSCIDTYEFTYCMYAQSLYGVKIKLTVEANFQLCLDSVMRRLLSTLQINS